MIEINTGGPAFPVSTRPCETEQGFGHQDSESTWQFGGMTLRDYFAAKAMQELVGFFSPSDGSEKAYEWADAMLEARSKK